MGKARGRKGASTAPESIARARERRETNKDIQARLRELRARFRIAHATALRALQAGDYKTLNAAIAAEHRVLDKQAVLIKEHRDLIGRLLRGLEIDS
jgi:hypothetical protein